MAYKYSFPEELLKQRYPMDHMLHLKSPRDTQDDIVYTLIRDLVTLTM